MPADYSKENSPVNDVEQKLKQYFESERRTLKAPDDLWSRIENRIEPPTKEPARPGPHGIWWLFRQWRLAGAAAAVLVLLVVSATVLTVLRRPDAGVTTPPLAPPGEVASPSPAPMFGAAPRGLAPDKGIPDEQARDDMAPTPFPATPHPVVPQATSPAPVAGAPGGAGPAGKAGAELRAATPAPATEAKPPPRPQATAPPRAALTSPGAATPSTLADPRRQIMSTASVSIEVKDVGQALEELRTIVESLGGFIGQLSRSDRPEQQQATVTVRTPQDQFSTALSRLESLGKIQDQASKSEDVTERFIDLEARLKALERQEQSLLSLLGKTQSVSEVLTIERELARTRGEIERIQGQLNFLKRQVDMATITANLFTPPVKPSPPPSASLSMQVSQVDSSINTVKNLVAGSNGAVDQVTISRRDDRDMAFISFRVFRKDLGRIIETIESHGTVVEKDLREGAVTEVRTTPALEKPDAPVSVTFAQPEPPKRDWLKIAPPAAGVLLAALASLLVYFKRRGCRVD